MLTPSLIVCVAFIAGVWALLRHEMAPKRRNREDSSSVTEDMSASDPISAQEESTATTTSEPGETGDQSAGSRSPGQVR